MKNILLVSPDSDNEALWVTGDESAEVNNNFPPLGLATVAALTSDEFHVQIWDELVHGKIDRNTQFDRKYDLVGLTGYAIHLPRCKEISALFRERGTLVAIGGPGVSNSPYECRPHYDILFINEVEQTWPRFLRDWQNGTFQREYRQIEKPNMEDSPAPKWDSIAKDINRYAMGNVQTTRGCPFDCEFCDVIYLFGRRPRHKPIPRVLEEVRALQRFSFKNIFFSDDEFSGDPRYSKELLHELIKYNRTLPEPLTYSTQIGVGVARDDEFLKLLSDANFDLVFVGVESPNPESLKGANKPQNLRGDLLENIHKIQSHGIGIRAGLIVGFDDDDTSIFDLQYDFIQKACFPSVAINMLKAPLGTPLWSRLRKENRVVSLAKLKNQGFSSRSYTNIFPKKMTRLELLRGFRRLLKNVYSWESFGDRLCGLVELYERRPRKVPNTEPTPQALHLVEKLKSNPEAAMAIDKAMAHTHRVAPHLLKKAVTLIIQHGKYCETVAQLAPQVDRQIELECLGELNLEPDQRRIPTSENFRVAFNRVFPILHRRIYLNLTDKSKVAEALTEVFVDFLVRWGEEFKQLEDYHQSFLEELCDRTCAKFSGVPPEQFVPIEDLNKTVPDIKRLRLADDVFKTVWQEQWNLNATHRNQDMVQISNPLSP
jgi:radical SAM superfamily enzyme YgiQ (UPF0313 family)